MNILQKIFTDYYEIIKYTLHPRTTELENIEKMIHCGDPSRGGAMYGCPSCGTLKFVPFRCHSRFCPSCGTKYAMQRTTSMSLKLINFPHRHCVFTIDHNLRDFFLKDRSLLHCLFSAVNSTISRFFFNLNKSKNFTPGFILVLHTFGRDLKWNPHIHCLISEGAFSDDGTWRPVRFFPFSFLRNAFRTVLLNELQLRLGDSFKPVKAKCYSDHKHGFYVYAKPTLTDTSAVTQYIGRYLGRPVIASSRIDHYDGNSVTFHYNRHEDNKLIVESIPAIDFIKRLIRHIPEKHFKMIRYGGLYARHRHSDSAFNHAVHSSKAAFLRNTLRWRESIIISFNHDPLQCSHCKRSMEFIELYFQKQHLSLQDLFDNVMAKSRGFSSSA